MGRCFPCQDYIGSIPKTRTIDNYEIIFRGIRYEKEYFFNSDAHMHNAYRLYEIPELQFRGELLIRDRRTQESYLDEIRQDIKNTLSKRNGYYIA
jgi:hypothetical protein